ncbi:MAG TPA: hypothetical protein VIQ30_11120 [Pseudonocardia sp.]
MSGARSAGGVTGGILGLTGGLVSGVVYVLLPAATIPLVGSLRAPELTDAAPDATSLSVLPVVPVAAVLAAALGLWLIVAHPAATARKFAAVGLIGCAALISVAYLVPFARVQGELSGSGVASYGITATSFAGSGFWLALIGAVVTAAGGLVELTGARAAARRA